MKRPPSHAEILSVGEEDLPVLAELAGVIWRQHYPGIISHEHIDYMLGKMYSHETLRTDLRSQRIHFYRLIMDGRMAGFASIGPLDVRHRQTDCFRQAFLDSHVPLMNTRTASFPGLINDLVAKIPGSSGDNTGSAGFGHFTDAGAS